MMDIIENKNESSLSTLDKFKTYKYELYDILSAIWDFSEDPKFKSEYRKLRNTQLKTILEIINIIEEKFRNLEKIKSKNDEKEYMLSLAKQIKNYKLLSPSQTSEINRRINILAEDRVKLKKINDQWFLQLLINYNGKFINLDIKKIFVSDYYAAGSLTRDEFNNLQNYIYWKIDEDLWGMQINIPNLPPIIVYSDDWDHKSNTHTHEVRHAKNHYIMPQQSEIEETISDETTAYAMESRSFIKWKGSLGGWKYKIVVNPNNISKIYEKLTGHKRINLDLLAIIPLQKWWIYTNHNKKSDTNMSYFTDYSSSSIIDRSESRTKLAREVCDQMWVDPSQFTWNMILENPDLLSLRADMEIFTNIDELTIHSKKIKYDISETLSSVKNLRTVNLYKSVYDQLNEQFLKKTGIQFNLLD